MRADRQRVQHLDEPVVRPVDVLEHEHQRPARRERGHQPRPGAGDVLAHLLRLHPFERALREREAGCCGKGVRHQLHLVIRRADVRQGFAHPVAQLVACRRRGIVESDAERRSQDLAERPVRNPTACRETAPAVDGRAGLETAGKVDELPHQPALPDAGGTAHEDRPHLSRRRRRTEGRHQGVDLTPPADDPRREPDRRSHAFHPRLPPEHPVPVDGPLLPLEPERDRAFEAECSPGRRVRSPADEDCPRPGSLLQARSNIHRVAGDDRLAHVVTRRRDHLPRVHTDANLECHPVVPLEAGVQLFQPLRDLEGSPHGSLRIVLARRRDAEHRENGVADVLLDGAAPRVDACGDGGEIPLKQGPQAFGIEPASELGRAGKVGEQHRGQLALLSPLHAPDRRGARVAETRTLRVLLPAPRADRHAVRVSRRLRLRWPASQQAGRHRSQA